jgi:hypothetical protein
VHDIDDLSEHEAGLIFRKSRMLLDAFEEIARASTKHRRWCQLGGRQRGDRRRRTSARGWGTGHIGSKGDLWYLVGSRTGTERARCTLVAVAIRNYPRIAVVLHDKVKDSFVLNQVEEGDDASVSDHSENVGLKRDQSLRSF